MQPPASPNVVFLMTADAVARVSGRNPIHRATYSLTMGHSAYLLRWTKQGEPDIDQVIQHVYYQSSTNTFFVFFALQQQGQMTYSWVREKLPVGPDWYDASLGIFWELSNSTLQNYTPPPASDLPIEQDTIFVHTTTQFDDYIAGMGGAPVVEVNQNYFGTAPGKFMTRYLVELAEFDYVQEEPDAVFYKMVGNHKEWHIFLRALCVKGNNPGVLRFQWQMVSAPGEMYSPSGLLRWSHNQEWVQVPLS